MKGTGKEKLYFSDKAKCVSSVKDGFNYISRDGVNSTYGAFGSSNSNRFIKACEQEDVVVCEQYRQGEIFLEEVL